MAIYFSSDFHFYHANIVEYSRRPYTDVNHMNQSLIDNWNSAVKDSDEIWVLGDFTLNEKYVPDLLKQLNGKKSLVPGNHDQCFAGHKRHEAAKRRYLAYGFVGVYQNVINFENEFNLSHMPYLGGGDRAKEERYAKVRLKDEGKWLLCGHVHELWKVKDRQINVGVDQWNYTPVSFDTLLQIKKSV